MNLFTEKLYQVWVVQGLWYASDDETMAGCCWPRSLCGDQEAVRSRDARGRTSPTDHVRPTSFVDDDVQPLQHTVYTWNKCEHSWQPCSRHTLLSLIRPIDSFGPVNGVRRSSYRWRTLIPNAHVFCRAMLCKRGLCRHAVSARPSVCPSRSWTLSKGIYVSSNFFHHRVATPF